MVREIISKRSKCLIRSVEKFFSFNSSVLFILIISCGVIVHCEKIESIIDVKSFIEKSLIYSSHLSTLVYGDARCSKGAEQDCDEYDAGSIP